MELPVAAGREHLFLGGSRLIRSAAFGSSHGVPADPDSSRPTFFGGVRPPMHSRAYKGRGRRAGLYSS